MQLVQAVMCADAGFVVPLAVALRSINDSQAQDQSVHVTVLSIGIGVEDRARVTASLDRIRVSFLDVETLIPADVPFSKARLTRATYGRLFAADAVAPSVDRLVYLDTDVLVQDDLRELAHFDLAGHPVAATRDVSQPVLSVGFSAWKELGMSPATPYFNAGVLVIDVQAWRARGIRAAALEFLYQHGDRCRYADQDGLNAVLQGDVARLPRAGIRMPPSGTRGIWPTHFSIRLKWTRRSATRRSFISRAPSSRGCPGVMTRRRPRGAGHSRQRRSAT